MIGELQRNLVTDVFVPYMVRSELNIKMVDVITYYQLLELYDKDMQQKIQTLDPSILNQSVFLFEI